MPGATEQFQRQGIELRSQQWEGNVDQTTGRRVPLRTLRSGPSSRQVRPSRVHPTKLRHRIRQGALHLDGVGSAAFPAADRTLIRSIWFSWPLAVSLRKPRLWPLDSLGFPRILSSESRFSMGLAARSGEKFFSHFCPGVRSATTGARGRGHAEAPDCSWGKLNRISDFLQ